MDNEQYPIFFMRENHTFKKLHSDINVAIEEIGHEMSQGWGYGSLVTKRPGAKIYHLRDQLQSVSLEGARCWLKEEHAQRATEAKPSASAAPGIDTPEFRELMKAMETYCVTHMNVDQYKQDRAALVTHIDAAIAAAREEESGWRDTTIVDLSTKLTAADAEIADLRARLAAPEGEAVAWMNPNEGCVMDAFLWQKDACNPQYSVPVYKLQPQAKAPQQPHGGPIAAGRFSMVGQEWRQMPRGVYEGTVILYHADGWPEAPK